MRNEHDTEEFDSDYLWDRSGQPDPQIQKLELSLARLRHKRPTPQFPADLLTAEPPWWRQLALSLSTPRLAAAALVILTIASGLWLSLGPRPPLTTRGAWQVQLSVASQQKERTNTGIAKSAWLEVGETLETSAESSASIAVAEIGRLEVEPMTRLRLLQSATGRKRIALDRGTIHATIWAPPGQFVVDTPSAVAVDLGCMYTLHIDESGSGILRTTLGWVGFRQDGHESFIPAGAACPTHARTGPGTPYFEDASEAFRSALSRLDSAAADPADRKTALDTVLREARPRDALTLWHLLSRVTSLECAAVYDRFAVLVPPPPGVTRDAVLHLDRTTLDSWWSALDLGDVSLWRHWEQTWTGRDGEAK
jgi:FecR protein